MNDTTRPGISNVAMTVALCFAVAVLEGFDIQAIGVAAPMLGPEFHLDGSQMKWVFAISNVGLVIGAAFGGRLADRIGRKPVFCAAVLTFGLFTLGTAAAQGYATLLAARFLAGLGFGAALPNMMAVAAEISAPERRASIASAMFCGMPFGGGLSALLTLLLPAEFSWRTLFIVGGLLPLLLLPVLYRFLPETLTQRGVATVAERPGIAKSLFGDRRAAPTLLLWLTFLPTLLILYLLLNWLTTLVIAAGLPRTVGTGASLSFNFASVVGALILGRIVDRTGARWPLLIAYGGLIGALIALAGAREATAILIFSGAAGAFLMGANYSLYGVAASYYPQAMRGTGSGASIAVGRVGSIAGPLLGGLIPAAHVIQYMAPVAAVAGIAVFVLSFFSRDNTA